MRPAGDIRTAIAAGFADGPGTTRELAGRTLVGLAAARMTLDNMRRAGDVVVIDEVRVEGVKRPVPLYDLRRPECAAAVVDWSLITAWAQFPAPAA